MMTMRTDELLTSSEVCELSGLSYRQLDYWVRTEKIGCAADTEHRGSGSQRLFSLGVVDEIKTMLAAVAACPFHG
jgi:DNA-binding transcriptional MerR regulator